MSSLQPVDAPARPDSVMCAACDHTNPPGAKFCNRCGSPVHLAECPHCEAINDRGAQQCYKCGQPLRAAIGGPSSRDVRADDVPLSTATEHVMAPAPEHASTFERAAAALPAAPATPVTATTTLHDVDAAAPSATPIHDIDAAAPSATPIHDIDAAAPSATPIHYVGVLTAPSDEAELPEVDVAAVHRARRARRVRYAAAALLVTPSLIAATLYGLEHEDQVDELVDYARVAVVAPLVRAANSVLDPQRNDPTSSDKTSAPPENVAPAPASQPGVSTAPPAEGGSGQAAPAGSPMQGTQAADSGTPADASAANTAR